MFHENKVQAGARNVRARFFSDGDRDMVAITFIDSKDEFVRPVRMEFIDEARPADPEKFPLEWAAFNSNRPKEVIDGTPLEAIPGLSKDACLQIRMKQLKTCERLAELNDLEASYLGNNGVAWRDLARLVLAAAKAAPAPAGEKQRKVA